MVDISLLPLALSMSLFGMFVSYVFLCRARGQKRIHPVFGVSAVLAGMAILVGFAVEPFFRSLSRWSQIHIAGGLYVFTIGMGVCTLINAVRILKVLSCNSQEEKPSK